MNSNHFTELHAIVHGHVQGVGFRAKVQTYALQLNLKGTVCNLSDGKVEICAQGTPQQLNQLLQLIKQNTGRGSVESITITYRTPTSLFENFKVL